MGNPKPIDAKLVKELAAIGCTFEEIGSIVGCNKSTISRRFATEIEKGRAELRQSIRRKQVSVALGGNVTMLIWLGKNLLDQRDKQEIHTEGDLYEKDPLEQYPGVKERAKAEAAKANGHKNGNGHHKNGNGRK